jgi:hypothetical protein
MATYIHRANGTTIMFDTAESVVKDLSSRTTDHPVETGSQITDHIITDPVSVQIEGFFSDAAFRIDGQDDFDLGPGRSAAIIAELEAIRNGREIFQLETRDSIYDNMVLTDFRVPRDSETGDAERVQIICRQIDKVERRFVLVPRAANDSADAAADELQTGRQAGAPRDQSALFQYLDSITKVTNEVGLP